MASALPIFIAVVGDGTTATFTFDLRDTPLIARNTGITTPPSSNSASIAYPGFNLRSVTGVLYATADGVASISGNILTITFASPISAPVVGGGPDNSVAYVPLSLVFG